MNKTFWKAALIRALRTFIQVVLAIWTAGTLITEVDWKLLLLSAVSATIYSLLTSILAGLPEVDATELLGADMQTLYDEYDDFDEEFDEEEV